MDNTKTKGYNARKITFLTTLFAILLTLPAFGFSLGDLLNLPGKTGKLREANEAASGSDSTRESAFGAATSESAIGGQQTNPGVSEARNPDSPSKAQATGGKCKKKEQGEIVC